MEMGLTILFVGLIVFLAHVFTVMFERTRVPDVLPLVLLGLIIGPLLHVVTPESFGRVGGVFTAISLTVILFYGGLELDFSSVRSAVAQGTRLTLASFVLIVFVVIAASMLAFGMDFLEAAVLGSILGATSPIIVIPLIEKIKIKESTRTILFFESAVGDVLAIVVALGLIQAFKLGELHAGQMMGQLIASFVLAIVIGVATAFLWANALHKVRKLENHMFLTLALVFVVFGITEFLGFSGAIASFAMGITLGNVHNLKMESIKAFESFRPNKFSKVEESFFAEVVFLIKTFFFVYIGLSIRLTDKMLVVAAAVATFLLLAVRLVAVRIALAKSSGRFDASISSAIVAKGLAPAVLAALPLQAGMSNGHLIQDLVYGVILFTIIATGVLTFLIEKGMLRRFYDYAFAMYDGGKDDERHKEG